MRFVRGFVLCMTLLVGLGSSCLHAQTTGEQVEDPAALFNEWLTVMTEFTADVRFTEADVKAFLEHWQEANELVNEEHEEEFPDIESILADEAYRSWAKSRGLNPETWMRASMRILLMMSREQMTQHSVAAEEQLAQQQEELEAQRSELGEEMYEQMKQALAMSASMMKSARQAYDKLPEPTKQEQALLDRYRAELQRVMQDEDAEEEW